MKKLFFLVCVTLLGACTQYQYITLDSDTYRADSKSFVWENDTVRLRYIFSGSNCPLTVQVYNKLAQPLYVDWKKSAIVYGDGSRVSLWNEQTTVHSQTIGGSMQFGNLTIGGSQTGSVVDKQEQISFIPPSSYISLRPLAVRSTFIQPLPQALKQKVALGNEEKSTVDQYNFTFENTPFAFRCFLTLSISDKFDSALYIDNPFWVTNIIQTTHALSWAADNQFYVSRTTAAGHIMGGVGTVALVAGAVYLMDATAPAPPPPPSPYHRR
jgi:hypothetical protein